MTNDVGPGSSFPLGATVDVEGVDFSLFSKSASHVDLVFLDAATSLPPKATGQ